MDETLIPMRVYLHSSIRFVGSPFEIIKVKGGVDLAAASLFIMAMNRSDMDCFTWNTIMKLDKFHVDQFLEEIYLIFD